MLDFQLLLSLQKHKLPQKQTYKYHLNQTVLCDSVSNRTEELPKQISTQWLTTNGNDYCIMKFNVVLTFSQTKALAESGGMCMLAAGDAATIGYCRESRRVIAVASNGGHAYIDTPDEHTIVYYKEDDWMAASQRSPSVSVAIFKCTNHDAKQGDAKSLVREET